MPGVSVRVSRSKDRGEQGPDFFPLKGPVHVRQGTIKRVKSRNDSQGQAWITTHEIILTIQGKKVPMGTDMELCREETSNGLIV